MKNKVEPAALILEAREHLLQFLSLSTPEEFESQLKAVVTKLMAEEGFNTLNADELKTKLLNEPIMLHKTPTSLNQELQYDSKVRPLAKLLAENNLIGFETLLDTYPSDSKIGQVLSRKFLGPNGKQTCLLNLAIEAAFASNSNSVVEKLLALGVKMDMDFGYHGQKHPEREVPPLVKAIQLSNESMEKKEFYTELATLLINKGASINKIKDNPSPLWEAYNPLPIPYSLARESSKAPISANTVEELHQFKQKYPFHLRNKEIFNELLERGVKIDEFDIISSPVKTPVAPPHMNGPKAFQLLYFIDEDLRNKSNYYESYRQQLKKDFFDPLFHKTYNAKIATGEKLQGYTFEFLDKEPNKNDLEPNKIYLYVNGNKLDFVVKVAKEVKRHSITVEEHGISIRHLEAVKKACTTKTPIDSAALRSLIDSTTKMGYPQRENYSHLNQSMLDEMVTNGEVFSNVTARYTGHISDFLSRIRTNDSGYIMSFMFSKSEKPFNMLENQCIAGEYNVPTHYYAARSRQMLEGVGFFYKHVQPHMTVKTDMFSVPREVKIYDSERDGELPPELTKEDSSLGVSVAVALDLEFKISNLDPKKAYLKAQEAEARRTLKVKEHSFRANLPKNIPGPATTSEFLNFDVQRTASADELKRIVKVEKDRVKPLNRSKIYDVKSSGYLDHNIELLYGGHLEPQLVDLKENVIHFYLHNDSLKCVARIANEMMDVSLEKLGPKVSEKIKTMLTNPSNKERLTSSDVAHITEHIDHKFTFPTSVYHGECLADIYQFDMILDIKNPQQAANLSPDERYRRLHHKQVAEEMGEDLYDNLLDLRALQKQRQAFLFTGREVPIARTDATTGSIKVLHVDEIKTIQDLTRQLLHTAQQRDTKIYKRLVGLRSIEPLALASQELDSALTKFAEAKNLDALVEVLTPIEKQYFLLWALDMGFRDLASELIVRNITLTNTLGCEKKVLVEAIEKGLVDEAKFLLDSGVKLNDNENSNLKTPFDNRFNYLVHFNNCLQLMSDKPEDKEVKSNRINLYIDPTTEQLMYAFRNKYHAVLHMPLTPSETIPQQQIDSIRNSIAQKQELSYDHQKFLSKAIPEASNFVSSKKLDVHFSNVFSADRLEKLIKIQEPYVNPYSPKG
jgi:hypothetical protein